MSVLKACEDCGERPASDHDAYGRSICRRCAEGAEADLIAATFRPEKSAERLVWEAELWPVDSAMREAMKW